MSTLIDTYASEHGAQYLGSARRMGESTWTRLNAIHLRSRWRRLCDCAAETCADMPNESEYEFFCAQEFISAGGWV